MAATKYDFKLLEKGENSVWDEHITKEIYKWGSLKVTLKGKDSGDFAISFLDSKDEQNFKAELLDEDGHGLCKVGGSKYLIAKAKSN